MKRKTLTVLLGAFVSRLLGFARDASFAWLLGGGGTADALAAALRLPFMVRRLFGEGALSLALTSASAGESARGGQGAELATAVARRLAHCAGLVVLVMLLGAPWLMTLVAPGLSGRPELFAEAVSLFRLCAPYLFFAMLAAGGMAALHSRERFLLPSLAPALFNIIALTAAALAWFLTDGENPFQRALWLAAGVLAGGVSQWLLQAPATAALRREERAAPSRSLTPELVRRVLLRVPLGIFGAAMPQMAFLIASILASFLPGGHLAALFYAERLLEFPLGVLGAAVGLTAAPKLARLASRQTDAPACEPTYESGPASALQRETQRAVTLALALNLPAAAGLMAVAAPLISVVLEHGAFDQATAALTSLALCAYAPGLPAYALSRPLLAACHALEDSRTPLIAAAAGLALTLLAGGGLMLAAPYMGTLNGLAGLNGLAPPLGVSLGIWGYALLLLHGVRRGVRRGLTRGAQSAAPARPHIAPPLRKLAWHLAGSLAVFVVAAKSVAFGLDKGWPELACLALAVPAGIATYGLALFCGDRTVFGLLFDKGA